uniref:Glucosylceramidase n=1 Tax=Acrobeloides nanus TaxID=290746 RepID=A0A914CTM2_9BILA
MEFRYFFRIGYTVARIPIASTDYSTRVYSYDDVDGDMALTNFALAPEDLNLKIPLVKWAQTLSGNKLRLFASVWSAPGWMKVVGTIYGGGPLKGDVNGPYYQTWANYFVRFFEEYAKNNVTFWGVTMENEPEMGADLHYRFQALFYNASMERDFAKGYWGQALRNNQVTQNLKLMFLDGERPDIVNWSNEVMMP